MNKSNTEKQFLDAYEHYADALFRHAFFKLSNRETAEDLVQEAYSRTWMYMTEGKKVENLRAFLYRVLGNLIVDEVRKKKATSLETLAEKGFSPVGLTHTDMELAADGKAAQELLRHLGEKQREAVVMRYINDLTPKEIAEITGESANVISVRIRRAIQKLQERINMNEQGFLA